jgi:hypothetical protein
MEEKKKAWEAWFMEHNKLIKSESSKAFLASVRALCMRLPEVTEQVDSFGHTSFRVKDKPFVMLGEKEEKASLAIKTTLETQEFLLQQSRYFKTRYVGQHGWVSLRSIDDADWKEIEELLIEGYSRSAPKRLVQQLNETTN